jgi:hypothetical protein
MSEPIRLIRGKIQEALGRYIEGQRPSCKDRIWVQRLKAKCLQNGASLSFDHDGHWTEKHNSSKNMLFADCFRTQSFRRLVRESEHSPSFSREPLEHV